MAANFDPQATFYGTDSYAKTDLQRVSQQVTDPIQLVGLRLYRRLTTPRGGLGLIGGDPNGGLDVRQYVNAKMTPTGRSIIQADVQGECQKDEQVLSAAVVANPGDEPNTLTITIVVQTADGPFTLTLNVMQLTVSAVFSFEGQV